MCCSRPLRPVCWYDRRWCTNIRKTQNKVIFSTFFQDYSFWVIYSLCPSTLHKCSSFLSVNEMIFKQSTYLFFSVLYIFSLTITAGIFTEITELIKILCEFMQKLEEIYLKYIVFFEIVGIYMTSVNLSNYSFILICLSENF